MKKNERNCHEKRIDKNGQKGSHESGIGHPISCQNIPNDKSIVAVFKNFPFGRSFSEIADFFSTSNKGTKAMNIKEVNGIGGKPKDKRAPVAVDNPSNFHFFGCFENRDSIAKTIKAQKDPHNKIGQYPQNSCA